MEFIKNELINETLIKYYQTFAITLDTRDYVPSKYNKKICKYIFKNMNKKFKEIEIYYLLILKSCGVKLGLFDKLKVYFSNLEPIYNIKVIKTKQQNKRTRATH